MLDVSRTQVSWRRTKSVRPQSYAGKSEIPVHKLSFTSVVRYIALIVVFLNELLMKMILKLPPDLKCVAALLRKI